MSMELPVKPLEQQHPVKQLETEPVNEESLQSKEDSSQREEDSLLREEYTEKMDKQSEHISKGKNAVSFK